MKAQICDSEILNEQTPTITVTLSAEGKQLPLLEVGIFFIYSTFYKAKVIPFGARPRQ